MFLASVLDVHKDKLKSSRIMLGIEKNPATYRDKLILVYTKITAYLLNKIR